MKKQLLTLLFTISTVISFSQVPSYVPTNGLVGYWPFNGNANDESGNGNNGTVNGASLTIDRFGNSNQAYSFNGLNNNISTSRNNLANFSVSLWFYTNQNDAYTSLIDAYNGNWEIYLKNLKPTFTKWIALPGNYQEYTSTNNSMINQWNHLVCTFNGNLINLYLNNILISTFQNVNLLNNSNGNFYFGASISGLSQFYNGKLDDIGIWNRALDSSEISNLYNGNICYQYITVTDTLIINTNLTGFNPVNYQNTIKIWPNPTNDHITIDYGNYPNLSGYQLKINNSVGQQMFQTNIVQQTSYVDLGTWSGNGIYFVHLIDSQGNTVDIRKIVLQ